MQGQTIEGENASLRAEVERLREREAASREILRLTSQNRSDERPVLDAITQNAVKLCDASGAGLWLSSAAGDVIRLASVAPADKTEFPTGMEAAQEAISPMGRCMRDARTISVADIRDDPYYLDGDPTHMKMIDGVGIRSRLIVPLVKNGIAFGCISLIRKEVRSFSDDAVTLIESFAEQAVIAIENVRQFREVRTRLEREKALREILHTISQSRDDEQPVFEVIVEHARRLCDATSAVLVLGKEGDAYQRLAAHRGLPDHIAQMYDEQSFSMDPATALAPRAILGREILNIPDMADIPEYHAGDERFVALVRDFGARSNIVVPLILGGTGIGALFLPRGEVQPYNPDEVALVESFAAQAVIAIENVRQFREVRERLEREKASAEILAVISQSRDDEQPVLDTIVRNAANLTNAYMVGISLTNAAGTHLSYAATWGPTSTHFPPGFLFDLSGPLQVAVTVREARTIHTLDLADDPLYEAGDPVRRKVVDEVGVRSFLTVPLVRNGVAFGCLNLNRNKVWAFTPDEVYLIESFAAQAVIAIENVRQFRALETLNAELGDRVEEQVGEIERMGRLKRFLPAAVVDTVVSSGSEDMLKSHRALLGVLFCDIRGFTAFCETAEPEETIEVLQTYHEEMGKLINAHGAGVDHRMGDGIMVLFNDPIPCDDPAGDAVRLAIAMRARMTELGKDWKRMGFRLGFGVGASLGYATVGIVGYEGRSDYTASGTAINVASRLCEMAEDGEILLSTRAAIAVEDDFPSVSTGEVTLKGIREPVEVFRLADGATA